jgi:branched-chain amino acid transport system substrate-binding protein
VRRPTGRRSKRWLPSSSTVVVLALACAAVACSSQKTTSVVGSSIATSQASSSTTATADTAASDTANATGDTTAATSPTSTAANSGLAALGPPTGKQIKVGLVNTEGTPGLDFPEIRINIAASTDYLNNHGGMGDRPIELVTCTTNGSPETSQACAQELVGKGVEMVLLGLDLFPDYATYGAASVPVIGVLPILPGDYTAKALFLTGGNATLMSAIASVAKHHFKATNVSIIGADNPGANSSEASLTAALDLAGIAHVTVKGGDNETDAGFQGLMREASKNDPDLLVSLYSDAGCIGTMRARASLAITTPVVTTGICSSSSVLAEVGDDAIGWNFSGVQSPQETPSGAILREIMAPVLGVAPSEVDSTSLGLGALGIFEIMSLAEFADALHGAGTDVTGSAIYQYLESSPDLTLWGSGAAVRCGVSKKYSSICSFDFPFAEYLPGGKVATIAGLEKVSSLDFLP